MLLIIVEGPDNSGKTTLAIHLQEVFSLDYTHCSKPKTDNPYIEYCELVDSIKTPTVIDRAHLGEYVYSKLWRDGCSISEKKFQDLDFKFMDKFQHVFVVHCDAPTDIIIERCIKEKEDLLDIKDVQKCRDLFDEIMLKTHIPIVYYDSSCQSPEDVSKKICLLRVNQ